MSWLRRLACLSVGGFLLGVPAAPTPARPLPSPPDIGFRIDCWEAEDGLPESSATAMVQTPDGYLWFGTFNGLVRFDGFRFTVFDHTNTPEFRSAFVINLHVDRRQRLWVSLPDHMLCRENSTWRRYGADHGWPGNYVRSFAEDRAGRLFCSTFDGKLLHFDNGHFVEIDLPPGASPDEGLLLAVDDEDALWALEVEAPVLARRVGQEWEPQLAERAPAEKWEAMAPARDGAIWLLGSGKLCKVRRGTVVHEVACPEAGNVWSLYEDSAGRVWIAQTRGGLRLVQPDGGIRSFHKGYGLTYDAVRFAFEDREGSIWIGTSGGGLLRYREPRFVSYGEADGLPDRVVRSVSVAGPDRLLVATYGGGPVQLLQERVTSLPGIPPPPLPQALRFAQAILEDRAGQVWIGTADGLWRIPPGGVAEAVPPTLWGGSSAYALFEDRAGTVWIGTDRGLARYADGAFGVLSAADGLPAGSVHGLAEDPKRPLLWIAVRGAGLACWEDGRARLVAGSSSPPIDRIASVYVDAAGTVWAGTLDSGLVGYRDGRVSSIGPSTGSLPRSINGIAEDGAGFLWLASNRGVVRVALAELYDILEGRRILATFARFDTTDGLASMECAGSVTPAVARDLQGNLWFATLKGLSRIRPADLRLRTNPPPVRIESVTLDGQPIPEAQWRGGDGGPLQIAPHNRRLEVRYTALELSAAEDTRFSYSVNGDDDAWVDAGTRRVAYLDHLTPGTYRFRVRAQNHDGAWNLEGAELAFRVVPPFWQRLWFRLLCLFLVVALTGAAVWLWTWGRMRQQRAWLERERSLLSQQARMASVIENTTDFVGFADAQRRPLFINRAGLTMLGLPPEADISRMDILSAYPKWIVDRLLNEALPAAMRHGVWRGETAIRRADGTEIPTSQVILAHRDENGQLEFTSTIIRDISTLKAAERALQQSEQRFRSVVESCPMGIHRYRLEDDGRLIFEGANPAADRILGVDHLRLLGSTIEHAFPALVSTEVPDRYRDVAAGGQPWNCEQIVYQHGQIHGVFELYAFQTLPGRLTVMFREISERKRAEATELSLRRIAESLSAGSSLRNFASVVARECRLLFHYDAFLFQHLDPATGSQVTLHAEDTAPGDLAPQEVTAEPPRLSEDLLTALLRGESRLVDPSVDPPPSAGGPWGFTSRRSQCLAFAPLLWEGKCLGVLSIQSYTHQRYGPRDLELLETVARQCAPAMMRLQTELNLRLLNQELESKVRERTDELQRMVNLMAGREIRMSDLKERLTLLERQLRKAGIPPWQPPDLPPA